MPLKPPTDEDVAWALEHNREFDKARRPANGKSTGGTPAELRPAGRYKLAAYDWLWPGWIARRKLHLLAGMPGIGKTTLALSIVATITRGDAWPDGTLAPVGDVVIWSGEDSIGDTLKPRLMAAGANLERVYFIHAAHDGDGVVRPFDPAIDMAKLNWSLDTVQPAGLLIDPIVSAIDGDSHKSAEVRRGLQPVVDLAERHDLAAIGVHHFAKNTSGRNPVDRVLGAVAFGAGPRMIMAACAAADPAAPFRLTRAKSNIGPTGGGFEYQLVQRLVSEDDLTVPAQYADWGRALEGSARDLLGIEEPSPDDGALAEAIAFLDQFLAAGPQPVREIEEAANAHGHAMRTIRRAKHELGAEAFKTGLHAGWAWKLPAKREGGQID